MKFTIEYKLPSLNDYIAACRSNRFAGAKMKEEYEQVIGWYIIQALNKNELRKVKNPCEVYFIWHEKTIKRDADNVAFAKKFILDALVKSGILANDTREYVKGFKDTIIDDLKDFVEVEIQEVEQENYRAKIKELRKEKRKCLKK